MLRSMMHNGQLVWPVLYIDPQQYPLVLLFVGDEEDVRENAKDMEPIDVISVEGLPAEDFNSAGHNRQVIEFRDTLDPKVLDTDGLIWTRRDDMVVVNQDDTEQVILVAASNKHQDNNLTVASAAMDTLHCCVGFYNQIHAVGKVERDDPQARILLDYLLQTLRKAGVQNVQDFYYEVSE